jgi:thiol-disulfide isomerase/thioredoxin
MAGSAMCERGRCAARLAVSVCALVLALAAAAEPAHGERAPAWQLDTPDGRAIDFHADAAGHPAVLLFWASWCPYCRALFPALEALRREYEPRGARFYALNVWEDGDPLAYLAKHDYGLTPLLAADLVAESYGIEGTPGVVVTDRDLRVRYVRAPGASPEQVAAAVRALLEAGTAPAATVR